MDSNNIVWKRKYVFAMMLSTLCMICSCCKERDKEILLKFKEGVTDSSGLLSSWQQEQDCCQWKGVSCHNITARVIHLSLWCDYYDVDEDEEYNSQKCLTGDINLSLLDMEYLQLLDLGANDFTTISSDSTVNSSTLSIINLSYNENLFIQSLEWLSRISSLEYIDLSNINLRMETNWLHWMTVLPSLVELWLGSCQLENISPSLEYANFSTSLQYIELYNNYFHSELPKWIFNLSSHVLDIDISSNYFMGQLPNTLPNLHSLTSLQLYDNYLNGSIPDWIGQLQYLTSLFIDDNYFSGSLPTNLGNLSSLDSLMAEGNLFTGVVSERNFAKLKNLKFLSLESPYITFDFDPLWIPPFQLDKLYIGPLHPTLPQWLYTQTSLYSLIIENSEFLLEAADNNKKFWRFTSTIQHLDFYNNTIEGDLSEVVLNSSIIELTSNDFKGGLPRLSSNVVFFQLSNSSLSGSISHLLCHSKKSNNKLQYLDLSDNNLSGGLTDCWMNWKSLRHVNLGGNNLSGNIPPSMALLLNLTSLHLHENNLSGDISSSSLQYCRSLSILNVRQNSFSGSIPKWMPLSTRILQLRSNKFISNIPSQICQMPFLIVLDIAYNRISGHIPKCLNNITSFVNMYYSTSWIFYEFFDGEAFFVYRDNLMLLVKGQQSNYYKNLKLMRMVDLSSNNLTGTMSPQLFSLPQLHFLNLSHNRLTGTIPKEIGNMTQLESLDLSQNELMGQIPESISSLSLLDNLNLSFNNLSGQIPSGTQLQSFSELSYIGNADLCGPPLPKNCSNHDDGTKTSGENDDDDDDDESEFRNCLYMGLGVGFAVGFWGVCGAIFFSRKCRHAYFRFLYDLRDRFYVLLLKNFNSFH